MLFKNVSELIQAAEENNIPIAEVMIRQEVEETENHGRNFCRDGT